MSSNESHEVTKSFGVLRDRLKSDGGLRIHVESRGNRDTSHMRSIKFIKAITPMKSASQVQPLLKEAGLEPMNFLRMVAAARLPLDSRRASASWRWLG